RSFSGTNSFVSIGDKLDSVFTNGSAKFTMECWLKPYSNNAAANFALFSKYSTGGSGQREFLFRVFTGGKMSFIWYGDLAAGSYRGYTNNTAAAITDTTKWYHVVAEYDGTQGVDSRVTFYMNGIKQSCVTNLSQGTPSTIADGTAYLGLGAVLDSSGTTNNGGSCFPGLLDEMRISQSLRSSNWVWAAWLNMASNSVFSTNNGVIVNALPNIRTDPPSTVTSASATLNGALLANGNADTAVFVYYGPTDGGTNAANWTTTNTSLGVKGVGAKSVTVTVPAGGETFYRYAASNTAGFVWADSSQYLITTNVAISVTPALIGETNAAATFWFVRPATVTGGSLTVSFTIGGTASNGVDYGLISATSVTLSPGGTTASLPVATLPDVVVEGNESLDLTETSGAYVLNSPATTTLTIADTPTVSTLAPSGVTATSASLNGNLSGATDTTVLVYYGPSDGGATAANWATTNTSLTAPQGVGAKSVTVTVPAGGETFYRYAASNAAGLVWATNSQYLIATNVAISVTPAMIGETNAVATFRFVRAATVTGGAVTVNFTIGGTASNGVDYSLISASNVFLAAGVTSATLQVTSLADGIPEGNEFLDLTETAGAYVLNSPATTTLTITDSTVAVWTSTLNTLVLQQGAYVSLNGLSYGSVYTNTVDTYIDQSNPNTSYGNAATVSCCRCSPSGTEIRRGYLRFENLQTYVPTNAVIITARIDLTGTGDGPYQYKGNFYYRTASWSPTNTWNSKPVDGEQQIGGIPGTVANAWWPAGTVLGIDVSAEAQGWLQGTIANYGLLFRSYENESTTERNFCSSDHPTVTNRPKLTITYALNTAQVSPVGYTRFSPLTRNVVMLSGSNYIQDTYIDGDYSNANYSAAASVNLQTQNGQGVKRALLQINTSSGLLSTFAKSTAPTNYLDKRLLSARLRIAVAGVFLPEDILYLWTCNQAWDPATVTFNKRDGSNAWSQVWATGGSQNVGSQLGSFAVKSDPLQGGCGYVDITSTLQAWIDGTANNGLVLGYTYANYFTTVALSEYGVPNLRPTLIVEYYQLPLPHGSVIIFR
ncbi:MAG: DNRLRE domain-containing protein, partial [bacterium]